MDKSKCALCSGSLDFVKYDLKIRHTVRTNIPLIKLIEDSAVEIFSTHFNACFHCYNLINELDSIILRQKEILTLFRNYKKNREQNFLMPRSPSKSHSFISTNVEENPKVPQKPACTKQSSEKSVISDLDEIDNLLNSEHDVVSNLKEVQFLNNDSIIIHNSEEECDVENEHELDIVLNTFEIEREINFPLKKTECTDTAKSRNKKQNKMNLDKNHKCQCSKVFRTLQELKNHMNSHVDHCPFICEICGHSYKHKSNFIVHMDMHNGINPFTCPHCKKSFTQKGALARHLPLHTGEMPYQCDECGKRFVHHTSFNFHRKTHDGERLFKCEICGLATMSGSHLKRHMKIHTGEKNYTCATCGKRFAERYNLASHEKLHKSVSSMPRRKKYSCRICGSSYERRGKLDEHLVHEHQTIKPDAEEKFKID